MSITRASSRFCESATREMLQDPTVPHFEKTMTNAMLRRSESAVIPQEFIRTHGEIFYTPELFLTGPNGHSRSVKLKVNTHDCVYLSRGWTEFVKNGFQVGDVIVFWMVKKSTFRVLYPQLEKNAVFKNPMPSDISSKDEKVSGRDSNRIVANVGIFSEAALLLNICHRRLKQEIAVPKCETNFNPAEKLGQQWQCSSSDEAKVATVKMSSIIRGEDSVKHLGLAPAASLGSRFPQFVKKLAKISLDVYLGLPFPFVKEHKHKFQAHVFLLGPSGSLRIVSLTIRANGHFGGSRVLIRRGWKAFALENGFKVGDVLLFSLVGLSKFVVQLLPSV